MQLYARPPVKPFQRLEYLLAGPAAEWVYWGGWRWFISHHALHDYKQVCAILKDTPDPQRDRLITREERRMRIRVKERWPVIEALATKLLDQGKLGSEVNDFLAGCFRGHEFQPKSFVLGDGQE